MIKLQVPNDPRLLQLAGEFLIAAASVGALVRPAQTVPTLPGVEEEADEEQTPPPPPVGTTEQVVSAVGPLDSACYPWDARIHAKTKSKIGDGTYKLSPGVDKALVAQVRAEYDANRGAMAALAGQTPPPPAETVAAAVTTPAATTNPVALFQDTMKLYAAATTSKLITADWAADWCKQAGLTGLPGLMANPTVCGQFADLLRSMGAQ